MERRARRRSSTGDAVNVAARLEQAAAPGRSAPRRADLPARSRLGHGRAARAARGQRQVGAIAVYRLARVIGPGPEQRRAGTPLAGRDDELAVLEREFDAVLAERRCRLVTVVGEPGVGKSRLAAELLSAVESRARVVRGACLSYGEGITYWAVGQIVRELAGIATEHSVEHARSRIEAAVERLPDGRVVAAQDRTAPCARGGRFNGPGDSGGDRTVHRLPGGRAAAGHRRR